MRSVQATVGAGCYGAGISTSAHALWSLYATSAPSTRGVLAAGLAGAAIGLVASRVVDRDALVWAARRDVGAYLTLVGGALLLTGFAATTVSRQPFAASLELLAGGALATVGGQALYAAANRARVDEHRTSSDLAIRVDEQRPAWLAVGARAVGVVLLASMAATGSLALQTGEGYAAALTWLLGTTMAPNLLAPSRAGAMLPGYGDERYLVDDGVLEWYGLASWDQFECWSEVDGRLQLHASGFGSNVTTLAPRTAADRETAQSLVVEHLPETE